MLLSLQEGIWRTAATLTLTYFVGWGLKVDPISEIVEAGANLIHLVDSLEPIHSSQEEDPF